MLRIKFRRAGKVEKSRMAPIQCKCLCRYVTGHDIILGSMRWKGNSQHFSPLGRLRWQWDKASGYLRDHQSDIVKNFMLLCNSTEHGRTAVQQFNSTGTILHSTHATAPRYSAPQLTRILA